MGKKLEKALPEEQLDFIRREANSLRTTPELAEMFNARFGTTYKPAIFYYWRHRLVPEVKLNWGGRERLPLGTERTDAAGYIRVKVSEEGSKSERWKYKHVLLWENQYGPCPSSHQVCFLDNDKTNFSLDNLMAIHKGMLTFMSLKKIPKSALKVPGAGSTLAALHQLVHQSSEIKRTKKFEKLPPSYLPVGKPGFAY